MAALAGANAHANQQLAYELGCTNCHGDPPQANSPTFAELARRYEKHRGDAKAQKALVDKLRADGHINAHARSSEASAAAMIRWLSEAAPSR